MKKIGRCAAAGNICSADPACSGTVHFCALQVVGAIKAAQKRQDAAQPDGKLGMCVAQFPAYLLRTVYGQRCFDTLRHFVNIFEELVAVGREAPADLVWLQAFADCKAPK